MAIDSEDKRRSVHGYTMTPIYPVADGTVDTQDRPHVGWIYRGLTIVAPVLISTLFEISLFANPLPNVSLNSNLYPNRSLRVNPSPDVEVKSQ